MKITTVAVECCFNTGNYENQRIRLEAQVDEGETAAGVVESLKGQIYLQADKESNWQQLMEQRRELSSLETQIAQARDQWEQTKTFLAAQGLRQDAPDFPIPGQKTLAAASTTVEVADFE